MMTVHKEPVLGVHDLAPPEGRVTIELLDERGIKVLQRVKSENAIMAHWNDANKRFVRGDALNSNMLSGYNFHGTNNSFGTYTDSPGKSYALGRWDLSLQGAHPLWGTPWRFLDHMRSILLTDSTEAVSVNEVIFPGALTAFCHLPQQNSGTNGKRGSLVLASCQRTLTTLRYQAEWGTTLGNGVINSVGIGGAVWSEVSGESARSLIIPNNYVTPTTALFSVDAPSNTTSAWIAPYTTSGVGSPYSLGFWGLTSASSEIIPHYSGHFVAANEIWILKSGTAGNNLVKLDLATSTVMPFSATSAAAGVSVTGPTMTTIGSTASRTGVAAIGSDLWLAYGTTLKRCVKPTNTSLTVSNTYAPSGVGTLVDITTDGTWLYWLDATKVWKINATTGAVDSSWNHSLTGTMFNIGYEPASGVLILSYKVTANTWTNMIVSGTNFTSYPEVKYERFSLAGSNLGSGFGLPPSRYWSAGSTPYGAAGYICPLETSGRHYIAGNSGASSLGSAINVDIGSTSHVSRSVLGATVTKTSANSLRCIYEFGF